MISPLFESIKENIFNQDPILKKKVKELINKKEEGSDNDENTENKEILLRDKLG
jgi:hypothetical protein